MERDRWIWQWQVVSFPFWAEALLVGSFCLNTHSTSEAKSPLHSFNSGAASDMSGKKILFGAMEMLNTEDGAGKSSCFACRKALSQEIQGHENLSLPLQCCLWALQPWLRFLNPHQEKVSAWVSATSHLSSMSHKTFEGSPSNIREMQTFIMHMKIPPALLFAAGVRGTPTCTGVTCDFALALTVNRGSDWENFQ